MAKIRRQQRVVPSCSDTFFYHRNSCCLCRKLRGMPKEESLRKGTGGEGRGRRRVIQKYQVAAAITPQGGIGGQGSLLTLKPFLMLGS